MILVFLMVLTFARSLAAKGSKCQTLLYALDSRTPLSDQRTAAAVLSGRMIL